MKKHQFSFLYPVLAACCVIAGIHSMPDEKTPLPESDTETWQTSTGDSPLNNSTEDYIEEFPPQTESAAAQTAIRYDELDFEDLIPEYCGEAYTVINGDIPFFSEDDYTTDAFETYSELDALGRCGAAFANICTEIMPDEPRGEIGSITPSGWHTVKYTDVIEGNYLYHRCHLIAYELAGENANELNLITGTAYFNINGMLPFENQVTYYAEDTGNHVLYRVTPVFEKDNLVADGVLMEAYSVEDHGTGICFCVFVYNIQPGIVIDYATGDSRLINKSPEQTVSETEAVLDYVLNTNSYKFHLPSCRFVDKMAEENKVYYTGTRSEVIEQGYVPCSWCEP